MSNYQALSFVSGEVPVTAKWNALWINDSTFNNGTGITALTLGSVTNVTNPYKFSVNWAAGQSGFMTNGGTNYLIPFDTKLYDTGNSYSTSTYLFTAPVTGFYSFNAWINFAAGPSVYYNTSIIKNTSTGVRIFPGGLIGGQSNPAFGGSFNLELSAGDTLGVYGSAGTAGIGINGNLYNSTIFEGFLVSNA